MVIIIGQIFGILALLANIICYQLDSQKKILITQIIAATLFIINLACLGGITGAIMNIHGIARALVYYQKGKYRWADSVWWVVGFIAAAVGITILTFEAWYDFLALIGTVFTTIALSLTDAGKIRRMTLPSPPCWFVYHLLNGNIGGVMNELFVLGSIVVGMLRLDRGKKGKQA